MLCDDDESGSENGDVQTTTPPAPAPTSTSAESSQEGGPPERGNQRDEYARRERSLADEDHAILVRKHQILSEMTNTYKQVVEIARRETATLEQEKTLLSDNVAKFFELGDLDKIDKIMEMCQKRSHPSQFEHTYIPLVASAQNLEDDMRDLDRADSNYAANLTDFISSETALINELKGMSEKDVQHLHWEHDDLTKEIIHLDDHNRELMNRRERNRRKHYGGRDSYSSPAGRSAVKVSWDQSERHTETSIRRIFEQYGVINSVAFGHHKHRCIVLFESEHSAHDAVNTQFQNLKVSIGKLKAPPGGGQVGGPR